jgi:hypothetical protein
VVVGAVGSLMRHFLPSQGPTSSIPRLPGRMLHPPRAAVLVAAASLPEGRAASPAGARLGAVAIAPIAVPAEEEHLATIASSTDHEPE